VEAFFVRVLTAVITNPQVQVLFKQLFAEALVDLEAAIETQLEAKLVELKAQLAQLEAGMVESIEALPAEILGDATKNVSDLLHEIPGSTSDIAGAVKGEMQPLIPTLDSLQSMFTNVIKNLPGGGFLGGILGK
jgi:hypothetical protein